MGGVEYQVTKVDPTDPQTKGAVYQVHKVTEEVAATLGGKVYRARIIKDPTDPAVAGKVYQIVLIGDPDDPSVKGKVYNAILTGGSEAVVVGPAVSPLALDDAIADTMEYVKAYGGTKQGLPDGYTQLEYAESTGTQYIDLGYKGNGNTKAEVKFKYHTASSATGAGRVFGSRTTSSSNAFAIGSSSGAASTTGNKVFWCYDAQAFYVVDVTFDLGDWQTVVFSATEHTLNGVSYGDDYNVVEFETPQNLKLFGFDNGGTMGYGQVDIAYCRLWDNGVLVRDLVPAKNSSNVIGMYDRVSGQFLTNQGTGDFVAGSTATPTPDTPMDVVTNNGVLKYSRNKINVIADNVVVGKYISAQGVLSDSEYNFTYMPYVPVKPNTTYTLSFSSPVYFSSVSEYSSAEDAGFVVRQVKYSTSLNAPFDLTEFTFTTGATTNYVRFGSNMYKLQSLTIDNVLALSYMLAESATAVPYAPYSPTGIYTDGTVETIGVYGGNLVDLSAVTDGYYYDPQGNYTALSAARLTDYIPVEAGKDVKVYFKSLSTTSTLNVRINIFDGNKVWQSQEVLSLDPLADGTKTITPADNGYIRVSGNYSGGAIVDWNTASVTESLGSATTEMLLKVGDYTDVQEILSGVVTRNVGIKVLDGTENWQNISNYYNISKTALGTDSTVLPAATTDIICTHYETISGVPDRTSVNVGGSYVNFRDDNISTLAGWKQYLADQYNAGTPVIVIYPLATPTTESVAGQTLQVQDGDNTLEITQASIDGLELEAEYEKEA